MLSAAPKAFDTPPPCPAVRPALCFMKAVVLSVGFLLGDFAAADAASDTRQSVSPTPAAEKPVAELIEDLGHPEYVVRERAQAELARLGPDVFDLLIAAENHEDLEIQQRVRYLLRSITVDWVRPEDPPEVRQRLERYDSLGNARRTQVIHELANLPDDLGLAAVCRLARYERSPILSKQAALEIVLRSPREPNGAKRAEMIEASIGESRRPAVEWLRTYAEMHKNPQEAIAAWARLAREEAATLEQSPKDTEPRIVAGAFYAHAAALRHQGSASESEAEVAVQQALGVAPDEPGSHYSMALLLLRNGLHDWAEQEFRRVIEIEPTDIFAVSAAMQLAEMLHDQGKERPAAEVLREVLDRTEGPQGNAVRRHLAQLGRDPGSVRSRMHYFFAQDLREQGKMAEAQSRLDEAVVQDPLDADVLIALYEMSAGDSGRRKKVLELIEAAAKEFRVEIQHAPHEHAGYNQLAWLIGNTEGDFDEAVRLSQKSLELRPHTAGYLDTLAHCYFAKKDYAKAVKHQERAAQLEPHSGLIQKKLKVFREALEKSQAEQEPAAGTDA